ncbi:MAG: thioredoxin family protein [bacterium]|nr:thioredoxin family protein [bacterium]
MSRDGKTLRVGLGVLIIALAVAVYVFRPAADRGAPDDEQHVVATDAALPRLLDLGADKCIPCKKMAPILDELAVEFTEVFAVEFVDVWKNPDAAKPYGLRVIPTQIFFAADGTELFRHEGFFGRADILAKWRELGVQVPEPGA